MSLNAVGNLLKEVMKDLENPSNTYSLPLYRTHLKALDSWYADLPIYLCLRETSPGGLCRVDPESNDRQKTAIVCLISNAAIMC
jgi:hypothetical protein